MLPYIDLFEQKIPMYGVMIVVGIAVATLIAWRFPVSKGIPRQDIGFASCYAGIGAFIGSRALYIAVTLPQILSWPNPPAFTIELVRCLLSGAVFYGGLFGGILAVSIYAKQFNIDVLDLIDALTPFLPLVHAFGRVGCFFAGCCYGIPVSAPWGLVFRQDSLAPHDEALFPVQLLEAVLNLSLFAGLFLLSRQERPRGRVFGLYLASYGVMRFALEFLRNDAIRGHFLDLSTSQWISLFLIPSGIFLLLRSKISVKKHRYNDAR
jgi:phosphatidylglycerol---prolipoprotein diacylglyceryl transferase